MATWEDKWQPLARPKLYAKEGKDGTTLCRVKLWRAKTNGTEEKMVFFTKYEFCTKIRTWELNKSLNCESNKNPPYRRIFVILSLGWKLVDLTRQNFAGVVKLVDTQRSGRCERKLMGVQISPPALCTGRVRFPVKFLASSESQGRQELVKAISWEFESLPRHKFSGIILLYLLYENNRYYSSVEWRFKGRFQD